MKIEIETLEESRAAAMALLIYINKGLSSAGFLEKKVNEDQYYTQQRETATQLRNFIGKSRY